MTNPKFKCSAHDKNYLELEQHHPEMLKLYSKDMSRYGDPLLIYFTKENVLSLATELLTWYTTGHFINGPHPPTEDPPTKQFIICFSWLGENRYAKVDANNEKEAETMGDGWVNYVFEVKE